MAKLKDDYINDVFILINRQWLKHSVNIVDAYIEMALEKGWMDEIAN